MLPVAHTAYSFPSANHRVACLLSLARRELFPLIWTFQFIIYPAIYAQHSGRH